MFTFYTHRKNTQHIMLSEKCILLTKNDLQMNYSHKFARHSHILESGERKPVRLNQFLSFVKMFHTFCIHIIHLNSFSHFHSFSLSFSLSLSLFLSRSLSLSLSLSLSSLSPSLSSFFCLSSSSPPSISLFLSFLLPFFSLWIHVYFFSLTLFNHTLSLKTKQYY